MDEQRQPLSPIRFDALFPEPKSWNRSFVVSRFNPSGWTLCRKKFTPFQTMIGVGVEGSAAQI